MNRLINNVIAELPVLLLLLFATATTEGSCSGAQDLQCSGCDPQSCHRTLERRFAALANFSRFCLEAGRFLEEEVAAPPPLSRRRSPSPLLPSWRELEEEDEDYTGTRDEEGRPHGDGGVFSFRTSDGGGVTFLRGEGRAALRAVRGNFVHGLLEGPALLLYQDGSASYLTFRHGTLHGPSYEVRPSTSAEDVGSVDLSFWHVRVAVETVGLYLEGQPAGRWWRRRSDGLEILAFHPKGRKDKLSESKVSGGLPPRDVLILYGPKQTVGNRPSMVRYDPETGSGASVTRMNITDGLGTIVNLEALETGEEFETLKMPQHLVRKRMDLNDYLSLCAFLPLQSSRYKEFMGKFGSFARDGASLTLQRNSTKRRLLKTYHKLTSGHPECNKFSAVRYAPTGSVHVHYFLRFPGSGSTWVLELLALATGFPRREGPELPAEPWDSYLLLPNHMSHPDEAERGKMGPRFLRSERSLQRRLAILGHNGGRHVLMVRNPYKAIVSWWNHLRTRNSLGPGLPTEELVRSLRSPEFCRFAAEEALLWRAVVLDAVSLSSELLVVHYETFTAGDLARVLHFLKVPADEERLSCARRFPDVIPRRRPRSLPGDVFCSRARDILDTAIPEVDKELRAHKLPPLPLDRYEHYIGKNKLKAEGKKHPVGEDPHLKERCGSKTCYPKLLKHFDLLSSFSHFSQAANKFLQSRDSHPSLERPSLLFSPLPPWKELEEEADYSGQRDSEGRPHGQNGSLSFRSDRGAVVFRGGADGRAALKAVLGNFEGGVLEGPALVLYQDGSFSHLTYHRGVLHGPSYERGPPTGAEDVAAFNITFWDARVTVETVGLYLNGKPSGRWWRRRSHGLEVVSYYPSERKDGKRRGKRSVVVPSAEVLVFYGPSQRPTGRDAIVNYNSASGSAAGVVSAEVAVGAGAIPNVSLLETKGGLESLTLPDHLRHGSLSLDDHLTLHSFLPLQSARYKEFMREYHTFVKEPVRFYESLWGNVTNRRISKLYHKSTEGHPECQRFSVLRYPPRGSVHVHYFLRFPGSGSTWVLELLALVTGFPRKEGSDIPPVPWDAHVLLPNHVSDVEELEKGRSEPRHLRRDRTLPRRLAVLGFNGGRHVLMVRDPYRAIVSWWNHLRTRHSQGPGMPAEELNRSLRSDTFCRFAATEAGLWRSLLLDAAALSSELLVLHYETFEVSTDLPAVLDFLRLPVDRERLRCAGRFPQVMPRRSPVALAEGAFCPEARRALDAAIGEVDAEFKARGLPPLPLERYRHYGHCPSRN